MDRNTVIGLSLIFAIFMLWQYMMAPSQEEIEAYQREQDSLARLEQLRLDSIDRAAAAVASKTATAASEVKPEETDSVRNTRLYAEYGPFAAAVDGETGTEVIENDLFKVTFSTRGGIIKEVELKDYFKIIEDEEREQTKVPLKLLEDDKNKFEYIIPLSGVTNRSIRTSDLNFSVVEKTNDLVVFRADAGEGRYFEQRYRISPGSYEIDYDIKFEGLENAIPQSEEKITLDWQNYLDKLEINTTYERNFTSIYFKPADDGVSYCSCRADDEDDVDEEPVKWVSHANQFFNSSLVADNSFTSGVMQTEMLDEDAPDLKKLRATLEIPYNHGSSEVFAMRFFIGPNEFERLSAMGNDLEEVVPFGRSILGTINRWIIRPIFSFLSGFIGNKGIVILVLTLIVKLALYPLTYRMLYSQSKMGALKPQLEGMRDRFKDDPQKQQMEQMKLYREFGVNPLGGCMPMALQMPIWIALYRFFPASIEFRQAPFLWATDLSSYDAFFHLPFTIPMGFGAHISLFTLLWAITTLIYTYYNTKHMDMSAQPAMKYMQYIMPLFFMGFFNSFASGLTCYLLFSNVMNITQTLVTKNLIIDQEKIKKELEANRKKPKKKSGFQERLEKAMKEQQRIQEEREAGKKKRKKK